MNYDLIDKLLRIKGMSRRKLALSAGIKPGTLSSAYARKTETMDINDVKRIAEVLDADYLELMGIKDFCGAYGNTECAHTVDAIPVDWLEERRDDMEDAEQDFPAQAIRYVLWLWKAAKER